MLGLVGGAPGGRHRASPIHRRRTQNITCVDGDEESGVGTERARAATAAAPETDDADEAERADVLAPLPAPQDELRRSDEYEESFEEEN